MYEAGSAPAPSGQAPSFGLRLLGAKILHYGPGTLIPAILALLSTYIFTRVFTTDDYGRYSVTISVTGLLSALGGQWLQQAVTRFLPGQTDGDNAEAVKSAVALASGLLVVVLVPVVVIAGVVGTHRLDAKWVPMVWPAAVLVLATLQFSVLLSVLQAQLQASRYSLYQLGAAILRFIVSLGLVLAVYRNAASLVWAGGAGVLVFLPWLWRDAALPALQPLWRARKRLLPLVRLFAGYGVPMVGWVLAASFLDVSDRYIIQLFRGSAEVGVYAANYALVAGAVGLISIPVLLAAHPFLMTAWARGDRHATARLLGTIVAWFVVVGCVLVGATLLFARDLARWLLGPDFRAGYRIMPVVLTGVVLWQLGLYVHKPLEFSGQTARMMWYSLVAALANVVANLLLVPLYGYMAAAYTTAGAYALYVVIATAAGRRTLRWTVPWAMVGAAGLAVLIAVAAATIVRSFVEVRVGYWAGLFSAVLALFTAAALVTLRYALPLLKPEN